MIKVLTVLGTRPEIIKMSLVLNEFDKAFKHIVVHTVSPQTPERTGELSITRNVILINTNIKATSDPNLPG